MGTLIGLLILIIAIYAIYKYAESQVENDKKRDEKIARIRREIECYKSNFKSSYNSFWCYGNNTSLDQFIHSITSYIDMLTQKNDELCQITHAYNEGRFIHECIELRSALYDYNDEVIKTIPQSRMVIINSYGKVDEVYYQNIIKAKTVEFYQGLMSNYTEWLDKKDYKRIMGAIRPAYILDAAWCYVIHNPYDVKTFEDVVSLFKRVAKYEHVDLVIARLYLYKQINRKDKIRAFVLSGIVPQMHDSLYLELISSALMWLNEYDIEYEFLQHLIDYSVGLSASMQDRLRSLINTQKPNGIENNFY